MEEAERRPVMTWLPPARAESAVVFPTPAIPAIIIWPLPLPAAKLPARAMRIAGREELMAASVMLVFSLTRVPECLRLRRAA